MIFVAIVSIPMFFFALSVFMDDFFGYIDAPVRFDRRRRKIYVWNSRKEGPIALDWDRIKPVAQAVSAPPYQVNAFRSVLLVDEDEEGEVRFEGLFPRIAQVGAAVLHREHTLAAYEYVRTFMERGPQALPPVKEHLVYRHRGVRPFVDLWGILQGFMHSYPSLPREERSPGWLAFGIIMVALLSCAMLPLQLAQGIAMYTTRVPKWPEEYEALAAAGSELKPPPGAVPNTPPMLPHEKAIATLWVSTALAAYLWLYFALWA